MYIRPPYQESTIKLATNFRDSIQTKFLVQHHPFVHSGGKTS